MTRQVRAGDNREETGDMSRVGFAEGILMAFCRLLGRVHLAWRIGARA